MLNDSKPIPDQEIKLEAINDFVVPPRGTSEEHEFDLFAHLEIEPEKEEEEQDEEGEEPEATIPVQLYKQTLP